MLIISIGPEISLLIYIYIKTRRQWRIRYVSSSQSYKSQIRVISPTNVFTRFNERLTINHTFLFLFNISFFHALFFKQTKREKSRFQLIVLIFLLPRSPPPLVSFNKSDFHESPRSPIFQLLFHTHTHTHTHTHRCTDIYFRDNVNEIPGGIFRQSTGLGAGELVGADDHQIDQHAGQPPGDRQSSRREQ